tara:strand:+ start:2753 stop:3475 length:723 start_codon:yes stop_codon:yes gene_type:complete
MKRALFLSIAFFSLINLPLFASTVIIKKGDTLTKIANDYDFTVREIMDLNNIIDANKLKEGQKLKLPKINNEYEIHIVKKGENLEVISKLYGIKKEDVIKLNKLDNPNYLIVGQKIYIKGIDTESSKEETRDNETIKVKENIDLNRDIEQEVRSDTLENTTSVEKKWKKYGPLQINWQSWREKDGKNIANAIHSNGKPLFVAVQCPQRTINRTGINGNWRESIEPRDQFEYKLIADVCDN